MNAILCPPISTSFADAASFKRFFDKEAADKVREFEAREQPVLGAPGESCKTNLFLGFFFDGTKNNYIQAESDNNHSNVARLYDCFPGLSVPGVLPASTDWQYKPSQYTHFFRTYIPGIASPFKEINDSGKGIELTGGAATGYKGEGRIVWALLQAINNVHRYFLKSPLLSPSETASLVARIDLSLQRRRAMNPDSLADAISAIPPKNAKTRAEFVEILGRLHQSVSQHWPAPSTGRPRKIDPGIVQSIHISAFGFSRGATLARVFISWLVALCRLDASLSKNEGMTLGGFKVEIDFLGLFDTVASVGLGNTFDGSKLGKFFDGHYAWADSESMRIPEGIKCLHVVSAHEVRRSFPLDSVAVGQIMPNNCSEVVFPGVHSDIGCGYSPCEQGRGVDPSGADMLARVPLVYMYKAARQSGVPLKLELASLTAQNRFRIAPPMIRALNAYRDVAVYKDGSLTEIMREQGKYYIQYRLARRTKCNSPLDSSSSFLRASTFDQNDLASSNLEFETEIAAFEAWLAEKAKDFIPITQKPGFDNEHKKEWEEIATWWKKAPALPVAILNFFDEYVHDSRASFKLFPGNPDNEADMHEYLKKRLEEWQRVRERNIWLEKAFLEERKKVYAWSGKKPDVNSPKYRPADDGLTKDQRKALDEYSRTHKIPRMLTEGREPFKLGWAGYLRFRKIYTGRDNVLISDASKFALDGNRAA